jgi:predicted dehydrogenase
LNNKINIAQIGVGYWGPNLLRNLVANGNCEVRTIIELSKERQTFVKGLYPSINVTDAFESVLDDDTIDAVVIATPVATHYELAMKSLKAGKHILVEKPMATTVREVQQIGKIAKEKGLVTMVGHTFLYNSAVRYLKSIIDSGEIGDIRYIYSQRLNLGRIRNDVDALWNLAPHDISIIQYLLGDIEPIAVTSSGMDYIQADISDVVFMNVMYPGKIIANIHVSWLDPLKVRKMTVVGSKKMILYDDIADSKIAVCDKGIDPKAENRRGMEFDEIKIMQYAHRFGDILMPKIDWQEPLKVEIDHFLDCINNGVQCLSGIDHAAGVVRILSASRETRL